MDSTSIQQTGRSKRPYVHRVNHGGNYCGHSPGAPRLELLKPVVAPGKALPGILTELQERTKRYYSKPTVLPSLRNANRSKQGRQQRSERREACLLLQNAIIAHTDLVSLRCGIPTAGGFLSLTLNYLVEYTGLHMRRAERAMADLKTAGLITCNQPRQLLEDGSYRGLAAVKAVNRLLFSAFGLGERLKHEMQRAVDRLAKKAKKAGGTLTSWARNKLVIDGLGAHRTSKKAQAQSKPHALAPMRDMNPFRPPQLPRGADPLTFAKARMELLAQIYEADRTKTAAQCYAEADELLQRRYQERYLARPPERQRL